MCHAVQPLLYIHHVQTRKHWGKRLHRTIASVQIGLLKVRSSYLHSQQCLAVCKAVCKGMLVWNCMSTQLIKAVAFFSHDCVYLDEGKLQRPPILTRTHQTWYHTEIEYCLGTAACTRGIPQGMRTQLSQNLKSPFFCICDNTHSFLASVSC